VTIARWFACPVTDAEPYLAGSGLERRTGGHVRAGQVMMRLRPPRETDGTVCARPWRRYPTATMCSSCRRWGRPFRPLAEPLRIGPGVIRAGFHPTGQCLGEHERCRGFKFAPEQAGRAGRFEPE